MFTQLPAADQHEHPDLDGGHLRVVIFGLFYHVVEDGDLQQFAHSECVADLRLSHFGLDAALHWSEETNGRWFLGLHGCEFPVAVLQ